MEYREVGFFWAAAVRLLRGVHLLVFAAVFGAAVAFVADWGVVAFLPDAAVDFFAGALAAGFFAGAATAIRVNAQTPNIRKSATAVFFTFPSPV